MKVLKDITTGIDGESYDVVRVSMVLIISFLPFILLWGVTMVTIGYYRGVPFDIQGAFTAVLAFLTGAGGFLVSGAGALFFKKSTEPSPKENDKETTP